MDWNFEPGRFYRQKATQIVYRCEAAEDIRALLHTADIGQLPQHETRLILRRPSQDLWEAISDTEEEMWIRSYSRDAEAEYGSAVGERGIVFRRQYHLDPYLAMLGSQELKTRLADIADNSIRYDEAGKVHFTPDNPNGWQRLAEEIVEELRLNPREGFFVESEGNPEIMLLSLPHDIREKPGYPLYAPWGRFPPLPPLDGPVLFKFGKFEHLRKAMDHGLMRLSPGSRYGDPSLDPAHHDPDEGKLILRPSPHSFPIILTNQREETILDSSAPRQHQVALVIGGDLQFYVWCCSATYEPRLFIDFSADACLIIHDRSELAKRINSGLLKHIPSLPGMVANSVRYYDPLKVSEFAKEAFSSKLPFMFFKHWRYAYQSEYRFVWPVPPGETCPGQLDIEFKPLSDICSLVRLN